MRRDFDTYNNGKGTHSYDVYAYVAGSSNEEVNFNVIAQNRDQAARRVERDGHRVNSVNMTG
jgi:hypothetical protein